MSGPIIQWSIILLSVPGIGLGTVVQSNLHKGTVFNVLNVSDQISTSCAWKEKWKRSNKQWM